MNKAYLNALRAPFLAGSIIFVSPGLPWCLNPCEFFGGVRIR
jgi:hypothetical protein